MQDHEPTPLDRAHAAMTAAPEDDSARLRYFARLADGMVWLWTEGEVMGTQVRPQVFPTEDGPVVLAFDSEERLGQAAGAPVPYAAMPGRVVARALAGQGVALGVNLGAEAPCFLVPPEALDWLAATLDHAPQDAEARPLAFAAPADLPDVLLRALEEKLARASGLALAAVMAGVTYEGGRRGHMLAFLDAAPGAEAALARAVSEALTFSGVEAGQLDVTFLKADAPAAAAILRAGLRIDLPAPLDQPAARAPAPPGTQGPPRLR
ncbi:MAG: SseB family protein [Gemmobacter sp.]